MRVLLLVTAAMLLGGCMKPWDVGGPWACSEGACPDGYACDEGICCVPGGFPSCPTIPFNGSCVDGGFALTFFRDRDGDGEGNPSEPLARCAKPTGPWVTSQTDCDDTNAAVNASTPEMCDGLDNNCNGVWDEGLTPQRTFYVDQDGDGYGTTATQACAAPPGYVADGGDCDDAAPGRHPSAPELCDGVDNNCDGVDDLTETNFADVGAAFPCAVMNGQGICATGFNACTGGQRRCVASRSPEREICDGLDNNCDGRTDEQPDCGGPRQLFGPDTRVSVMSVANASLATRCNGTHGTGVETLNGRAWSATASNTNAWHLMVVQPADGGVWDLSGLDVTLNLTFASTPAGWGALYKLWDPQVSICGATDAQLVHYRPNATVDFLVDNTTSVNARLPLNATSSDWLIAVANGLDSSNVSSLEILLTNSLQAGAGVTNDFTVTFDADAGFSKP